MVGTYVKSRQVFFVKKKKKDRERSLKHHVLLEKLISFKQRRLMPETVLWET